MEDIVVVLKGGIRKLSMFKCPLLNIWLSSCSRMQEVFFKKFWCM